MATDFTPQIISWINAVQYRTLTNTDPLVSGFNTQMNAGSTAAQIQAAIEADSYTTNFVNVVLREYQAAFGRVPDQAGAKFWVSAFASGGQSLSAIANVFASSAEFNSLYGAGPSSPTTLALVTSLYTNVLGRGPDVAGLTFWASQPLNAAQLLTQFA